jgi:tetratricopeptide (TPR) repeat protein
MQLGRFREAKDLFEHHALEQGVAEVGPNFAIVYAHVLSALGDPARGVEVAHWLRLRYPGYASAWGMQATLLARAGRVEQAERLVDTLVVRPLAPASAVASGLRRVGAALIARGDTAAGRRTLSRALALLERPSGRATDRSTRSDRAQVLYELGRHEDAHTAFIRLAATDTANVDVAGYLGLLAAECHDGTSSAKADARLTASRARSVFTRTLYRARIAAASGQREQALTLLAAALDEAGRFLLPAISEYAEFASLRNDPEFRRLMTPQ